MTAAASGPVARLAIAWGRALTIQERAALLALAGSPIEFATMQWRDLTPEARQELVFALMPAMRLAARVAPILAQHVAR